MGGNLSTLPEDELIKAIEDPNSPGELNQEHVAFHRSTCLNERTAKLRTQIGDQPLDDITTVSYTHLTLPTICSV